MEQAVEKKWRKGMGLGGRWLSEENGEMTNTTGLMEKLSDPLLGEPRISLTMSQLPGVV